MLVLSRKLSEKVLIGSDIEIVVVDIDRGKIRLGITCPRAIPIFREEVLSVGELAALKAGKAVPK